MNKNPIYLDYNSTTPLDSRILQAMLPYFTEKFGNPASQLYEWGWTADRAVQFSKQKIASFLGCHPYEIFFTSGATESNNWVLEGVFRSHYLQNPGTPFHVLTTEVEHKSILKSLEAWKPWGLEFDLLPVDSQGRLCVEALEKAIKPHTKLISVIWVNNEIGTINPIEKLGLIAKKNKIYFHTDATQALGKVPISLEHLPVDLLSLSGHKIYGPKGVGALYIRSHDPKVSISPLIFGGDHQQGLRSGTLNVPGIVGLGEACSLLQKESLQDAKLIRQHRDLLWKLLQEQCRGVRLNGPPVEGTERAFNNLNITFPVDSLHTQVMQRSRIALSAGSACNTSAAGHSHVLQSLGLSDQEIQRTVRISLGKHTTYSEIIETVEVFSNLKS